MVHQYLEYCIMTWSLRSCKDKQLIGVLCRTTRMITGFEKVPYDCLDRKFLACVTEGLDVILDSSPLINVEVVQVNP